MMSEEAIRRWRDQLTKAATRAADYDNWSGYMSTILTLDSVLDETEQPGYQLPSQRIPFRHIPFNPTPER